MRWKTFILLCGKFSQHIVKNTGIGTVSKEDMTNNFWRTFYSDMLCL